MEGVLVYNLPVLFTEAGGRKLGSVTRSAHSSRENKTEGRIEARRRQGHQRLARIESRGTNNSSQVGRAR
jgi:hypothetical protein